MTDFVTCTHGTRTEPIGRLVDVPAVPKPPTVRQQLAIDYVLAHDGVTAEQVGAHLHAHRAKRPHPATDPCDYCHRDGRSVLTSVAVKPLVTYRRVDGTHLYVARNPCDRVRPVVSQVEPSEAELAVDPFAGL